MTYRLQATNRTSNAPKELRYSKETEHLKAEIAALHAERDTLLQLQDALLVKLSAYQDIAPDKVSHFSARQENPSWAIDSA